MLTQAFLFAQDIAHEAGQIALDYFRGTSLQTRYKKDQSPVTVADEHIERFLRAEIEKKYPDHQILGEEYAPKQTESDYLWVLDPIDGTRSFSHGIPVFGVQVALTYKKKPILGVIDLPALNERIAAAHEQGCFWNQEKTRVSSQVQPERFLVHIHERDLARKQAPALGPWLETVENERNWGDCYSFVLVATGRAEVAMDPRMQVWDSAPLPVLLAEAGGVFFDWQGQNTIWSGSVVTAPAHLEPLLRSLLEKE